MSLVNAKKYRLMTKTDADGLHHQIFDNRVNWALAVAPMDAKMADLKAQSEAIAAPFRDADRQLTQELESYIEHNKELFQKPRKPKTAWGNYGLQGNPRELQIDDPDVVKKALQDAGLIECYTEQEKIVTALSFDVAKLMELLGSGKVIPGCRIVSSEEPKINVNQKLVDEAVKGVKG